MTNSVKNRGTLEITTPSDREVVLTRAFDAPRRLVFDAYTKPEHLPRWMLGPDGWTMPVCEIDLRPGGAYRFVWSRPGRPDMEITGVYREVSPPDRLVNTENWGSNWPETINTVTFNEQGGRTTVTCLIQYPSSAARDAALKTGMKDGAAQSYDRLEEYLRGMSAHS